MSQQILWNRSAWFGLWKTIWGNGGVWLRLLWPWFHGASLVVGWCCRSSRRPAEWDYFGIREEEGQEALRRAPGNQKPMGSERGCSAGIQLQY